MDTVNCLETALWERAENAFDRPARNKRGIANALRLVRDQDELDRLRSSCERDLRDWQKRLNA